MHEEGEGEGEEQGEGEGEGEGEEGVGEKRGPYSDESLYDVASQRRLMSHQLVHGHTQIISCITCCNTITHTMFQTNPPQ